METKVEKNQLYQQLATCKLLPLYTATDLRYLPQVESVLVENELPFIEVTFRSQLALPAIKQLAASGNLIVGAGTVRTLKEAQEAVANGAQFIVSPAIVPEVIDFCLANEVPIFQEQLRLGRFSERWRMAYEWLNFSQPIFTAG